MNTISKIQLLVATCLIIASGNAFGRNYNLMLSNESISIPNSSIELHCTTYTIPDPCRSGGECAPRGEEKREANTTRGIK